MKNIFILLGLFVTVLCYAQPGSPDANGVITPGPPDWVTGLPVGDGEMTLQLEYLSAKSDTNTNNITSNDADILINSTQQRDSTGVFNVFSYGAISRDGLPDQDAFQAATNAAAADGDRGGTVRIPNGTYNFTGPDTLKSYVTYLFDKNARINVAADYTGEIFVKKNGTLEDVYIDGGYYYGDGNDWNFMDIEMSGISSYANAVHINNVEVRNGNVAFDFYAANSGWVNIFTVHDSWFQNQKTFVRTRDSSNTSQGIDYHIFDNITLQAGDSTVILLDSITGDYNKFTNNQVIDLGNFPSAVSYVLNSTAYYNEVESYPIQNSSDNGFYNKLNISGNRYAGAIADSARMHEDTYATGNTYNNRLILSRNGAGGSAGSPGGDNALKMYAGGTPTPKTATGSNYSARIVVQNESGDNRSSHMKLQVHESSNANAESNYIDAIYLDGSAAGFAYFSDAMKLTLRAEPPTEAGEGTIYVDTDHHIYFHNGTTWVQLDN